MPGRGGCAAPASCPRMAGLRSRWWPCSVRLARMSSLAWPVMAEASASRRHDLELAAGDQLPWPANARTAWRSRSAVTVMPAHSSGTGSALLGVWRGGGAGSPPVCRPAVCAQPPGNPAGAPQGRCWPRSAATGWRRAVPVMLRRAGPHAGSRCRGAPGASTGRSLADLHAGHRARWRRHRCWPHAGPGGQRLAAACDRAGIAERRF